MPSRLRQIEDKSDSIVIGLLPCDEWPKKLYIFQHIIPLEPFKIKRNGFQKNVPRVSGNKD